MLVPLDLAKAFNPAYLSGCHCAIPKAFPPSPRIPVFKPLSCNKLPTTPAA